eukprot:maker-scaffold_8-snap-gene-7.19-mRNA-1 protein AED:0.03 eAED:0.03 QI:98/0.5/0.66/1/1/1/3/668/125
MILKILQGRGQPIEEEKYLKFLNHFTNIRNEKENDSGKMKPWCPDCEAVLPIIEKLYQDKSKEIFEVHLTREEWKETPGKDHFLRFSSLQVNSIPTLFTNVKYDPENGDIIFDERFDENNLNQLA